MPKKLIIGISVALVLVGAVVLTVLLVRSRALTDETPIETGETGSAAGNGAASGGLSVPSDGSQGTDEVPQAGPCGDGVCSEGESWCTPDCGDAEERFLGSIGASDVTATSFKIVWRTDKPSTGEVGYGLTERYELGTVASEAATSHAVQIRGLSPGTNYFVRVRATEEDGVVREATALTFETSGTAR